MQIKVDERRFGLAFAALESAAIPILLPLIPLVIQRLRESRKGRRQGRLNLGRSWPARWLPPTTAILRGANSCSNPKLDFALSQTGQWEVAAAAYTAPLPA
jgi:hypothetical protein